VPHVSLLRHGKNASTNEIEVCPSITQHHCGMGGNA
jgi:hypothetical protein